MPATIQSLAPLTIGSTVYPVKELSLPFEVHEQVIEHSGNLFPSLLGVPGADPKISFKMPFATAFAAFGFGANKVTTLTLTLAIWASFTRSSSAVHTSIPLSSSASANVMMSGWSVDADGWLLADLDAWLMAPDSSTHPLATPTTSALPSLVSQPAIHTFGPMKINGALYPGLMSVNGALQNKFVAPRHDGTQYPLTGGFMQGQPRMTGAHSDPTALFTSGGPLNFLGANISSNIIQYFRSFDPTTGVSSNTNAISITCASGRIHPKDLRAADGTLAASGLEVIGLSTSSTHPFAVNLTDTCPVVS